MHISSSWAFVALLIIATFGPQVHSARPEWGIGAYLIAAAYAGLLLISVLAHELAHTLAALSRGYRVQRIVADLWGGHTAYDANETTPGHQAFISVVGPLANIALAGLGFLALNQIDTPEAVSLLLWAFTWSNTFVAAFNLLPGLPLDGGFIVDALVWKITGNRASGMRAAGWCGRLVAVLVIAWAIWQAVLGERSLFSLLWMGLIASFLWRGASAAVTAGGNRQVLSAMPLQAVLRPVHVVDERTTLMDAPETGDLLLLTDAQGQISSYVEPGSHVRVPLEHRATTPLSALAHAVPEGSIVPWSGPQADITDVLPAFATTPTPPLAVVVDPQSRHVVGVATYGDVERALQQQAHRLHSSP